MKKDHHFEFVQFPFNLFENAAYTYKNIEGYSKTILQYAREKRLCTVANRPLNSFVGSQLIRLAEYEIPDSMKSSFYY